MSSFKWQQHHLPQQQLLQKQVESASPRNLAYITGQFQHALLTEGFGCDAMRGEPGRVKIRPPPPRQQDVNKEPAPRGPSCEPQPRPIIRRRARSLPCSRERKRGASREGRSQRVRFVDSLGLELAEVKVFRAGEDPMVPLHVLTRLMLSSELALGRDLVIPIPYLEPDFPPEQGKREDFLERLAQQRVCLGRVSCSELGIAGLAWVQNLSFRKEVSVRYSFTAWKSSSDTKACWDSSEGGEGAAGRGPDRDVFRFCLPVPPFILEPGASLEFAIRYRVLGAEFWDNNNGRNYSLTCHSYKLTVPKECEDSWIHFI
ncbi:protein phosphatase 1 regulatory subunit 3D-like [Acipenser oxyrinchus oxyrinchus]|uniref:Protein phosphatase 1 regulatory subunit 3D-like n=1 Tax=Acipenser oxyrinchus oxyrinchus TaxID=40147 RepID=A0AAD8CRD8_ACIOX|nr:protein phosphatase 1 regulatory subunit 3D-like [Acipenser oxyrinchus oxyrinchus]